MRIFTVPEGVSVSLSSRFGGLLAGSWNVRMTFRVREWPVAFERCRAWSLSTMSDTSVSILMCLFLSCMSASTILVCSLWNLLFGKCAPANRLGNAGATLGRFAQGLVYRQSMPCGRTLSDESSCFSGKTKRLLAGIGTSLICR